MLIAQRIFPLAATLFWLGIGQSGMLASPVPDGKPAGSRSSAVMAEQLVGELAGQVARGEAPPIKCATPYLCQFPLDMSPSAAAVSSFPGREDTLSLAYATDHFLLHYTDVGSYTVFQFDQQDSLPGIPDYIYMAGRIFEEVYTHTVTELGFDPPVSDDTVGGGTGLVDVYFIHGAFYGATMIDSLMLTTPYTATAYIFMENDYEGFVGYENNRLDALRVTAAHEFFHVVQFAIDVLEMEDIFGDANPAWMEMTATFMEEEHFDNVDDYYNYLPFYYAFPQWSLRTGTSLVSPEIYYYRNLHMYGSVLFPIFLAEMFGPGMIKNIWDRCGMISGPNWWTAADQAIKAESGNSLTLRSVFGEFALWNLFTGEWARPGYYFPEGNQYPRAAVAAQVNSYPAVISVSDSLQPDNLGTNYIVLSDLASVSAGLAVSFEPDRTQPWALQVVGLPANVADTSQSVYIDPQVYDSSTGLVTIPDASAFDKIVLIPSVPGGDAVSVDYSLTVSILTSADEEAGDVLPAAYELSQNRPNPFNPTTEIPYALPVRSHVTIRVSNILGQSVCTLVDRSVAAGEHTVSWDGRDSQGRTMPSGVYFYTIEAGRFADTKKMVLVR